MPPLLRRTALIAPESPARLAGMMVPSKLPDLRPVVRALGARLATRRGAGTVRAAAPQRPENCPGSPPPPRIEIPVRDTPLDAAQRGRLRTQGRYLARQEEWDTLARGLREADAARDATPGGTPVARLLAEGACSDAMDGALAAVGRDDPTAARAYLFALRDAIDGAEREPWLATMLARAHLGVAEAWAARTGATGTGLLHRDARAQHLEAAQRLIAPFDALERDSPGLAALRCALLDLDPHPERRVVDDYEDLIDLDPACPDHLRALGRDLTPRRFGDWGWLDREARRTAGHTKDIWGLGGYAWVWFDALAGDAPGGFAHVDAELFAEGLHDILHRRPDQHMANLLAAYCGLTLSGAAAPGSARARIAGCFGWIAQDHLREVHPDIWARARPIHRPADGGDLLRLGRSRALSALAEHFAHQLARGRQVRFAETGVVLTPSPCASCTLAPCSALAYPRLDQRDEDAPCLT